MDARVVDNGNMLRDLHRRGIAPASTDRFLESLRVMNEAPHGVGADAERVQRAVDVGTVFLAELKELGTRGYPPPRHGIYALYPHSQHASPRVRVFIDFLAEVFGSKPSWEKKPKVKLP